MIVKKGVKMKREWNEPKLTKISVEKTEDRLRGTSYDGPITEATIIVGGNMEIVSVGS